ncbi:hypothetical protein SFIMM107S_02867 [Streptomyces griseus]
MDGRPLEPDGSQLVVPRDRCGARYVSSITRVWVGAAISPCTPRPRACLHANFPPEPARQIRTTGTPGA